MTLTAQRLSPDDLTHAWAAWHERRDPDARADLIEHYTQSLVRPIAIRMARTHGLPSVGQDWSQDGVFGLCDAIDRFDPTRGVPFGGFAGPRIQGSIWDAQRRLDWVSRSARDTARDVDHAQDTLTQRLGRTPTQAEIEQHVGAKTGRLLDLRGPQLVPQLVPIDTLADIDDTQQRQLADRGQDPESAMIVDDVATRLAAAVAQLDPQLKAIAALTYVERLTTGAAGRVLGVSPSRVSQLQGELLEALGGKLADGALAANGAPPTPPRQRGKPPRAAARALVALVTKHATTGTRHRGRPYATWRGCVFGICIIDRPGRQAALDHALATGLLERDDRGRIYPPGMAVHVDARAAADLVQRHAAHHAGGGGNRQHPIGSLYRGCRVATCVWIVSRRWAPDRTHAAVDHAVQVGWLIRDVAGRLLPPGIPPDTTVQQWIEQCCRLDPDTRTPSSDLLHSYRAWCRVNNIPEERAVDLAPHLRAVGCSPHAGSGRRWWLGITLQDTP